MVKKFWTVWSPQSPKSNPTVKHELEPLAVEEARRLARHLPGQEFFVMKSVYYAKACDVFETEIK